MNNIKVLYTIRNRDGYLDDKVVRFDRFESAYDFAKTIRDSINTPIVDVSETKLEKTA